MGEFLPLLKVWGGLVASFRESMTYNLVQGFVRPAAPPPVYVWHVSCDSVLVARRLAADGRFVCVLRLSMFVAEVVDAGIACLAGGEWIASVAECRRARFLFGISSDYAGGVYAAGARSHACTDAEESDTGECACTGECSGRREYFFSGGS